MVSHYSINFFIYYSRVGSLSCHVFFFDKFVTIYQEKNKEVDFCVNKLNKSNSWTYIGKFPACRNRSVAAPWLDFLHRDVIKLCICICRYNKIIFFVSKNIHSY